MKMNVCSRTIRVCAVSLAVCATTILPARAAFHLWSIQEVYSDSSGSLQFIELVDNFGAQNFVNGQSMTIQNVGATQTHTFTIPGNPLGGSTFAHTLLLGTAGLQAAGGPAPDYIIPNGFLFTAGGSISFWGLNSGAYGALPTDGSLSLTWANGTDAANSPQNFAGQTGMVTVPEPGCASLLLAALAGFKMLRQSRPRHRLGQ